MEKVVKSAEITMQNAVLLKQETRQLREENRRQKRKRELPRCFIQTGGSLAGANGQQKAQEEEEIV